MHLLNDAPLVANRSCDHCRTFMYNEDTGKLALWRGEKRPRLGKVPCDIAGKGCKKGHYSNPIELSTANKRFYTRYREWLTTNSFPDDEIVRTLSGCIGSLEGVHTGSVVIG